jgi:GNAT superfamily N-acetyltransferase
LKTSLASPADSEALSRFFEACGSACFCRYWHFAGDKNDWLDRCANHPEENRAELVADLGAHDTDAYAVIARERTGDDIVGWLKLVRPRRVPKIVEQRYYRGLPCLNELSESALVIGCMLVRPSHRHRGVARALVRGAVEVAPRLEASTLIALPRVAGERVTDEELWLGPLTVFADLGFREVHSERPYPVLSLDLTREAGS